MNVLYISYDGMTDALGRSQVIPYLEGLSALGHHIHILSCEKKNIAESERQAVRRILEKARMSWTPLSFSTQPPFLSKLADVVRMQQKAIALHREHGFDAVHCRSYIASLAGLKLKKQFGVSFIFDMRGFWANERIEGGLWNLKNPLYRVIYNYFKKREADFFHYADAVVSLTHNGKGVIAELFGNPIAAKTYVIPCCADTDLFSPQKNDPVRLNQLRSDLGLEPGQMVLSYLGSIGTWYMTHEMLLFFKALQRRYPDAKFLFITGDDPGMIHQKARQAGVDTSKVIVCRALRDQVPLYLALSQLSIYFIRPVFSKKASSPTKQAEIMSMGIPAITNAGIGDTDSIISEGGAGVVVELSQPGVFEKTVEQLDGLLTADPVQIRQWAIKHFSLEDGVDQYAEIYQQLQEKKKLSHKS